MQSIYDREFWAAVAERAFWAGCASGVTFIGYGAVNALLVDWRTLGGMMAGGALFSALKSCAMQSITPTNGPSGTGVEVIDSDADED